MINLFIKNSKRGFTLIELLVVVSIIGLLASIVVVSLGGARQGGRDAKREADIRQLQNAMELCNSTVACGGLSNTFDYPGGSAAADIADTCAKVAANLIASSLIASEPKDPNGTAYTCFSNGASYCISTSVTLEKRTTYAKASDEGYTNSASAICSSATDK